MERGCGRVNRRGALLGPEESGRLSSENGSVFLGHYYTGIFADLGVAVWLGPVFTKPLVMILLLGVFSLVGGLFDVGGGCGWCSCPYFENCIVDASIFVVFVV